MARKLSSDHLSKYLEGGIYHDFLQYVKSDKELAFEIRVKDEVMIYCQKNLILKISHRKNTSDNITMLNPRYYTNRKDGMTLSVQLLEPADLQDTDKVRLYFEDAKALCKRYKSHDEFVVQQQYKSEHSSFSGKYLAIDMEWAPDQAKIPVEYRVAKTKVDLLIVSNEPNEEGKHGVYLAEVKCGLGAVDGKSGIEDHVRMSQGIINNVRVRQALLQDVMSIIKQKTQLQLFEGTPIKYNFSERPQIMFILANSSEYDKLSFDRIINNLGEVGHDVEVEYLAPSKKIQPAKARYGGDSDYRKACRHHQAWFRENILKVKMGRNHSTRQGTNETAEEFEHRRTTETDIAILTSSDAARLMNFVPEYHEEIRKALCEDSGKIPTDFGLMANMLRSEHVPWNIFVPMMTDLVAAAKCFSEVLLHRDIKTIRNWKIEFAPNTIQDKTAFDVYVEYETAKGETGVIGIEVKYTEEGYSVGNKEFFMMQNPESAYSVTTRNSECFINNDPMQFNNPDFIQLWRNHILGLAMLQQGMTDYFDSLTLYPSGNVHFHSSDSHVGVIESYEELLTDKGKDTFHAITYEDFFNVLKKYYLNSRNSLWLDYLETRYINMMS
jgi:hypothetical protein